MKNILGVITVLISINIFIFGMAFGQNIRASSTGPTTAKGHSHSDQFIHLKDVKPADNMYPVIQHPERNRGGAE